MYVTRNDCYLLDFMCAFPLGVRLTRGGWHGATLRRAGKNEIPGSFVRKRWSQDKRTLGQGEKPTYVGRERCWGRQRAPDKKEIAIPGNVKSCRIVRWGITQVRHAWQVEELAKSVDQGRRWANKRYVVRWHCTKYGSPATP